MKVLSQLLLASLLVASASAFLSSSNHGFLATSTRTQQQQQQQQKPLHMTIGGDSGSSVVDTVVSSSSVAAASFHQLSNNFLLATVDQDIAKMSDNEFAPIFAGGILVMFGGVASALIVGAILESRNSYANVIADSYAQSEDDEDFWKGLSDEEATKTRELLQRLKDSKEGKRSESSSPPAAAAPVAAATSVSESQDPEVTAQADSRTSEKAEKSSSDMFSDY